jgi:membrane protease YdiL (CAAX protease family)
MTVSNNQSKATQDTDFTKTWRYKIGFTMIVVGNLGILLALFMPALGVGAGAVGTLVVGGEIVSLASIAFLGKEGFKAIKSKFVGAVKASYTGPVGPSRHYIGITLLATNVVIHYIVVLYLWDAFGASTAEGPPPVIWGLDFAQQESLVSWLFLICEISFLSSIYVLGADWWGKFRNMVVWEAPAD